MVLALGDSKADIAVESHLLNRQISFGSDVMTRLESAQRLSVEPLQKSLHDTLRQLKTSLSNYNNADDVEIFCAGNSAMVSFLHAWDITTLATSPFQPLMRTAYSSKMGSVKLTTLPLLAGFVGADTFAGILHLENRGAKAPWMLIDIGTNTEIVLKTKSGQYWVTSAPAGPAFEGGNISVGMRAEPGAIAKAQFDSDWKIETIGRDIPSGICGSGLIDVMSQAVANELIKVDGYVPGGELKITENIALFAEDIREFQLAKSATRSGCDMIIDRSGETPQTVYLSGTFAENLDLESVFSVGLIPKGIKAEQIGNTSLRGAMIYATLPVAEREAFAANLAMNLRPVELALQDDFQDLFVRNLELR